MVVLLGQVLLVQVLEFRHRRASVVVFTLVKMHKLVDEGNQRNKVLEPVLAMV